MNKLVRFISHPATIKCLAGIGFASAGWAMANVILDIRDRPAEIVVEAEEDSEGLASVDDETVDSLDQEEPPEALKPSTQQAAQFLSNLDPPADNPAAVARQSRRVGTEDVVEASSRDDDSQESAETYREGARALLRIVLDQELTDEDADEMIGDISPDDLIGMVGAVGDLTPEMAATIKARLLGDDDEPPDNPDGSIPDLIHPESGGIVRTMTAEEALDEARAAHTQAVQTNVFTRAEITDWDYGVELSKRTTAAPYILHEDEYHANEVQYDQKHLRYYEGDNILCDDDNKVIYDVVNTVGDLNFGHGSTDPMMLFVRNPETQMEYAIELVEGLFTLEVHGVDPEPEDLVHSHRPRRFRQQED